MESNMVLQFALLFGASIAFLCAILVALRENKRKSAARKQKVEAMKKELESSTEIDNLE